MRILVCLKQVRDPESRLEVAAGRPQWLGKPRYKMSALDEAALEQGLTLKDATPGAELWVVTVGPAGAAAMLRRAMGMGADHAAHLLTGDEPPPRPAAVAGWIAAWARDESFDLVLTGVMSEDAMQGQTGPALAQVLDLPLATSVVEMRVDQPQGVVLAEREMEGGRRQVLELPLPALLTIQSGGLQPRYPTLSRLLRANKAHIPCLETSGLGREPDRERISGWARPRRRRAALVLPGTTREKAEQLWRILQQRGLA